MNIRHFNCGRRGVDIGVGIEYDSDSSILTVVFSDIIIDGKSYPQESVTVECRQSSSLVDYCIRVGYKSTSPDLDFVVDDIQSGEEHYSMQGYDWTLSLLQLTGLPNTNPDSWDCLGINIVGR